MPLVGAGTWEYNNTQAYESLCNAFEVGYTYLDTAWIYGNEVGVGQAIKDCWLGKGRLRKDLFVTTKINGGLNATEVRQAHADNLNWLGLDYVDNLLQHFPCDWDETPDRCNPARRQEQWLAMEGLYHAGLTRSIGISHFCKQHIDDVLAVATVRPCINQVEWHIGSGDEDNVMEYSRQNHIYFQSFSPLCGPCTYNASDSLIDGVLVTEVAANYPNVTGSQVSLKYLVQFAETESYYAGVIPKSSSPAHLKENINLFHFMLSDADMARLGAATAPAAYPGDCDAN